MSIKPLTTSRLLNVWYSTGFPALAYHSGLPLWACFLPSLALLWLNNYNALRTLYYRLPALFALIRAKGYILILPENAPNLTRSHTNYAHERAVIGHCLNMAEQLNAAENGVDTLTNELGIKRTDDE